MIEGMGMSFSIDRNFLLVVQNVIMHLMINGILYLMNWDIRKWEIKLHGLSNCKVLLSSVSYQDAAKYGYEETKKKPKPYFCISIRLLFVFIIILLNKTSYTKTCGIYEIYKTRGQKLQKLLFSE